MNLRDYIIAQEGLDWSSMLKDWNWILPTSFEVWIVTRFADLIIVREDRSIWLLDTSSGVLQRLADSKEHFGVLADSYEHFAEWFMVEAVEELVAAGTTLGEGQCYSYKLPPGLGGAFDISNYMVTDIAVHLSIHGQIFLHIKDIPDGTRVKFTLK